MQVYPVKVDGVSSLGGDEYNDLAGGELNNFVQESGQTLSAGNPSQLGIGAANYAAHGDFFTDSGSPDTYILATQASKKGPNAYIDGMRTRFEVGNTNTGASTVNVASLGVKDIKQADGSDLTANQLSVGDFVTIFFDSSSNFFVLGETSASRNPQFLANGLENAGLGVSFGSGAMTIALKQKNGTADPTGASPVKLGMRDTDQTNGGFNYRTKAVAASLVISSGSTLGLTSAVESKIYVYAIEDGSGGIELAASQRLVSEDELITTVAEGGAGAADDKFTIYSTTLRAGVPIQLIGYIISTQTTAGTWAQTPTTIWIGREPYRQKIVYIKDLKTSGTNAGATTANTVHIRDLNDITGDISIANLVSDQFILGPGDYDIEAHVPSYLTNRSQAFLFDITGAAYLIDGIAGFPGAGGSNMMNLMVIGKISLAITTTFEIRHWTTSISAQGLGLGANGTNNPQTGEVYTTVKITKLL